MAASVGSVIRSLRLPAAYDLLVTTTSDSSRAQRFAGGARSWVRPILLASVVALPSGVLTAYAQAWLPEQLGSLANSTGTWALLAFLLARLATSQPVAATLGSLSLLALLAGYIFGADVRGYPSSFGLIVFWTVAALLAGPLLGLASFWVKSRRGPLAALGAGGMSGVLVGEGVYGITVVADSTYQPYWWGEIAVGLVLLLILSARRLADARDIALGAGTSMLTAVVFVFAYSQDLIGMLSG